MVFFKFKSLLASYSERTFLLLAIALFFMPISNELSSILIGVLFVHAFFSPDFKLQIQSIKGRNLFVIFGLFFLVYCLSGFHSHNASEFEFEIEKKLSYIFLPFAFVFIVISESQKFRLLSIFAYSCVFWLFYCLCRSAFAVIDTGDFTFLYMDKLADWIGMLRVYFSLYLFFSVVILWFDLQEGRGNKKITVFALLACLMGMFLFMSRIQLPVLLFFACLAVFRYFKQKGKAVKGLAFMFTILVGFSAMIYYVKPLNRQFIGAVEKFDRKYAYIPENANGVNERLVMWDCSVALIKENAWFGVGVGDLYDDLTICYRSLNLFNKDRAPSHNQYLQVLVSLGIVGFVVFMGLLMVMVYESFRSKDVLYQAFVVIICLSFFTESILELQRGIVFVVMIGMIFYVANKPLFLKK